VRLVLLSTAARSPGLDALPTLLRPRSNPPVKPPGQTPRSNPPVKPPGQTQVKIAELPLDSFRMLQALEWEDPGAAAAPNPATPVAGGRKGSKTSVAALAVAENGSTASGSAGSGNGPAPYENPSKHLVYRPTALQLLSILTTTMELLPRDGVLLLHVAAAQCGGRGGGDLRAALSSTSNLTGEIAPGDGDSPHPDNVSDVSGLSFGALTVSNAGTESGLNLGPTKAHVRPRRGGGAGMLEAGARRQGRRQGGGGGGRTGPPTPPPLPPRPPAPPGRRRRHHHAGGPGAPHPPHAVPRRRRRQRGQLQRPARASSPWLPAAEGRANQGRSAADGRRRPARAGLHGVTRAVVLCSRSPHPPLPRSSPPRHLHPNPQGQELSRAAFCFMSPAVRPPELGDPCKTGALLTLFLTGPLMAFCQVAGNTDPSVQQLVDLQATMGSVFGEWGALLLRAFAAPGPGAAPRSPWAPLFRDALLRRLILRYVLARAALGLHAKAGANPAHLPRCFPDLPKEVAPAAAEIVAGVHRLAACLGRGRSFGKAALPPPSGKGPL
jgi:hypothetical protein